MKNFRRAMISMAIALVTVVTSGCAGTKICDTGITNETAYSDYAFWEDRENETCSFIKYSQLDDKLDAPEAKEIGDIELSSKHQKDVRKLRKGMISFFSEKYDIDISEKLEKQEIKIFKAGAASEDVMGYVYDQKPNILNLNYRLESDLKELFCNTYIHESLHQLGFQYRNATYFTEGITDALTDMILCYMGMESITTEFYFETRTLAYQILQVDKEIVRLYLENDDFNPLERIDSRLKGVAKKFKKGGEGKQLESGLFALYSNVTGIRPLNAETACRVAIEAQSIVQSYCRTFDPSHEQIDFIRSHYLVQDFEALKISKDENGKCVIH